MYAKFGSSAPKKRQIGFISPFVLEASTRMTTGNGLTVCCATREASPKAATDAIAANVPMIVGNNFINFLKKTPVTIPVFGFGLLFG